MIHCSFRTAFFISALALICCSCRSTQHTPPKTPDEPKAILKMGIVDDPGTVDPRQVRDLQSATLMHMLFEGLMRYHFDGKLIPAVAENMTISPDLKTYTFTLRDTRWSNGDPVTADDFVYSWKKILDPAFPAPNAYQFFDIKGAKAAKEGKESLDEVGIYAPDAATLVVELEQPTPYFPQLTAFHAFFPVNRNWDQTHPSWTDGPPSAVVSNGPFTLSRWAHHNVLIADKNSHYWDVNAVNLDQIVMMVLEDHTALQMFERGSLHWAGSPLLIIPPDAVETLKKTKRLHFAPGAGTHWFRFNTEAAPFNNANMRKAFSYAINRKDIVDHILQGNQPPAAGIIPPSLLETEKHFQDHHSLEAKELFQKALEEMDIIKDQLPPIHFSYRQDERAHKIAQAVQQQWQKAFDIPIHLDNSEGKIFLEKVAQGNYQIANGSWFADFRDPINFLDIFRTKNNATNQTHWENADYSALLERSANEVDPEKRFQILKEAEDILMNAMPVAPVFYYMFNYVKKDSLKGVYFSDLGYLDFKHAYLDEDEVEL